jgi:hypothetical protein
MGMANNLVSTEPTEDKQSLYERDYYTWALRQTCALKEHRLEELDWENLADEVEGLAKTERRELRSWLEVLLEHLLKWQFQATRPSGSWRATIAVQRLKIREHLDENPGLKPSVPDVLVQAYKAARVDLTTRFLRSSEPQPPDSCPRIFDQIMDEQFWPE